MIKKLLSPRSGNILVALLGVFWLSALGAFAYLTSYELTAGNAGVQSLEWPTSSELKFNEKTSTAVVFLHPRCGCSLATANELAKISSKAGSDLKIYALVKPTEDKGQSGLELSSEDKNSSVVKNIDSIPGVIRITDSFGNEARKFGAETSGDVLLYSRSGKLLFVGGITASRGHEGDNFGADALLGAVRDSRRATVVHTPVFGCSLMDKG